MANLIKFEDCREQIENLRKFGDLQTDRVSSIDASLLTRLILSQQAELETLREAVKGVPQGDRTLGNDFDARSVEADKKIKKLAVDRNLSYSEALDQLVGFGEVEI